MGLVKNKLGMTVTALALAGIISCGQKKDAGIQIETLQPTMPVLAKKERNAILRMGISLTDTLESRQLEAFTFSLEGITDINDIAEARVLYSETGNKEEETVFGTIAKPKATFTITGSSPIRSGEHNFWLSVELKDTPELTHKINAGLVSIKLADGTEVSPKITSGMGPQRIGIALKQAGEDNIDTYRIPGLATTNKGTLIAVYDNRYNDPVDLQEDIDVGMSRSTDGGQTWEPMKVIMDMGEYGGLSEDQNGIGDPAVLVDKNTNTIWVAALWLHGHPGERAWNASQPGMSPKETGQLILVKSEDDGVTWSKPINITSMTKKPEWQLFFNGPGSGITMENGTLVFAAQYKDKDRIPHSTIIYSEDGGQSWIVGTGAKSETTEAQVVEISNGVLMLNMRDDRNRANRNDSINGRSVAISTDMGKTWEEHPTSREALIEPNCMASILAYEHPERGKILFFSNPNSKTKRNHITIKTSFDGGMSWPEKNQLELYEEGTYGYSCLTMVDEDHIGILYEGVKELYFQKIPISDLIQ